MGRFNGLNDGDAITADVSEDNADDDDVLAGVVALVVEELADAAGIGGRKFANDGVETEGGKSALPIVFPGRLDVKSKGDAI